MNDTLTISAEWVEIIQGIPGYDAIATAGDCYFDESAAQMALNFFPECLTHVKGELAGEPFELEPWETSFIANLFGWKRPDGSRRYREALLYIPRKNGKTTLAGGLVNLVLFCDKEPGAEIYSAAADRYQAALVFQQAAGMVRQEPELNKRAHVYTKAITMKDHSGSYMTISSEAHTKHGYNTHLAVVDELHAQPNDELVNVLETSVGSRRQPLIIHITTADFDRPSVCNEKHEWACKVRDGDLDDPSFLPVIFETDKDEDWGSLEVWKKANPCLGKSLKLEYLERQYLRAQEQPSFENSFKRLHLNMKTEQAERWIRLADWDKCDKKKKESLTGMTCYGGIDLASTSDLASLALFFPEVCALLEWFWVPADNAHEREKRDRVKYETWGRQGWVTLTPGNVIDLDYILKDVTSLGLIYNIEGIAIDRWGAIQIQKDLIDEGFDVVPFGQGFASMSSPSKAFEVMIVSERLKHQANPVMRWNVGNVAIERDAADNIKPSKKKSPEKIDGVVAGVMAVGCSSMVELTKGSVYDERGVQSV